MARGKYNKHGGGRQRLDAVSAEEIEIRNQELAEYEEERAKRRNDEDSDEGNGQDGKKEGAGGGDKVGDKDKGSGGAGGGKSKNNDESELESEEEEATVNAPSAKPGKATKGVPPVKKTTAEEHKRNLAKLEAVRKRREEAEARRKNEKDLELAQELEMKAKVAQRKDDDNDRDNDGDKKKGKNILPKLTRIEIKKMKPTLLKEALKERGLDIQGQAKDLQARLTEYEEGRG